MLETPALPLTLTRPSALLFMPKNNNAQIAQAMAAPPLPQFKHLVTSMAVTARSEAALSGSPPPPIAPEIKSAWSRIVSPERVGSLAMAHFGDLFFEEGYYGDDGKPLNARAFPFLSDSDCSLIALGLRQCAQDILQVAEAQAFERAAKLHAALIVSPGGDDKNPALSYPLMGLALRPAKALAEGKRVNSLAANWLARAGDAEFVSGRESRRAPEPLHPDAWVEPAGLQGAEREDAITALEAALELMPEVEHHFDEEHSIASQRFAALLAPAGGPAALSGEDPLPQARLIRAVSNETGWRAPSPLGVGSASFPRSMIAESKSRSSAEALTRLASNAISLSFVRASPARPLGKELAETLSLSAGPISQALPALNADKHFKETSRFDLFSAIAGSRRDRDFEPEPPLEKTDKALDDYLLPLARRSADPKSGGVNLALGGGEGRGLIGLSNALGGTDARLGLIQWAASGFEGVATLRENLNVPEDEDDDADERLARAEAVAGFSPARAGLAEAIESVQKAIASATARFISMAVDQAELAESAWMERLGLLGAWRQAQATGPINSQSLAWAFANPVSDLLASADPMLSLGARCAKAWGLRVESPLNEAAFSERFNEALAELGAHHEAREALSRSEPLRATVARLSSLMLDSDKEISALAKPALGFTLRLAQRAGAAGLPPDQIAACCAAYADTVAQTNAYGDANPSARLAHFRPQGGGWDSFGIELGAIRLKDAGSAELAKALSEGKAERHDQFLDALIQDWAQTREAHLASGGDSEQAEALARGRAAEMIQLYPRSAETALDWRQPLFSEPAWSVLGFVSPRFSAARLAAESQGALGKWCARIARPLGIRDAADGNDLIGKTREAIKAATGLSDGAWKQIIKEPGAMQMLAESMGLDERASRLAEPKGEIDPKSLLSAEAIALLSAEHAKPERFSHRRGPEPAAAADTARVFSAAARLNIALPSAMAAARALLPHKELFGDGLKELRVSGAESAEFYLRELRAKLDREPSLIQEAAKRFEKLQRDALAPPKAGEIALDPAMALREETRDLADWIGQSELGVWQTLAERPTWNQLRRASGEWHAEQAAMAQDKLERQEAKAERERQARAQRQRAPGPAKAGGAEQSEPTEAQTLRLAKMMGDFANATGASWPKVLGRHARDGWQAVELLSADALLAEGSAMSHCVSSYSGQCRSGETRIFSILLNDERVCTLQISGAGNLSDLDEKAKFHIVQNRGKANKSIVSKAALDFCEETRAAAQSAWRALCSKRRAAREAQALRDEKEAEARRAARKAQLLGEAPAAATAAEPAVGEKLKARRSTKPASRPAPGKAA